MDLLRALHISATGLTAHRSKMNVIAENLANNETTRTEEGGPYRRKMVILEEKPPNKNGHILGFEPLVFNYSLSCSWLCNGLDTQVEEALGTKPNQHGLIDSFDRAVKSVEYISRDDVGAEPGLWFPWLIIDHTKRGQQRH